MSEKIYDYFQYFLIGLATACLLTAGVTELFGSQNFLQKSLLPHLIITAMIAGGLIFIDRSELNH